jgi:sigma-B regulation protein RsbU (phosphoserine phosphatase)
VLDDFHYREQQVQLERGDTLILFTDGLSEAEDAQSNQFGKERIARCLAELPPAARADEVLTALRHAVTQFMQGATPADDLTLLVIRWRGAND